MQFSQPDWRGRKKFWEKSDWARTPEHEIGVGVYRWQTEHGWRNNYYLMLRRLGEDQVLYRLVLSQSILASPTGSNQTTTAGVDASWNNSNNTIEVVGGGGAGAHGASTSTGGGGGGGGAYNRIANFSIANPGVSTFTWQIGAAGLHGGTFPQNGGDTWFNSAAFPVSGTAVGARGGASPSTNTTATGGAGGLAANGFPTTSPPARSGGTAGNGASATAGGGGGGAGGPNGDGGAGSGTAGGTGDGGTVTAGAAGNPGTSFVGTEWTTAGVGGGAGGSNASGGTGGTGKQAGGGAGGGARSTGIGGDGGAGLIVLSWTPFAATIGSRFTDHEIPRTKNAIGSIALRQMLMETASWISPPNYCAFQYDFQAFQIVYGNPTYQAFQGCIAVPWGQTPSEYDVVHNYLTRLTRGSEEIAGAPFTQPPAVQIFPPFADVPITQLFKPRQLDNITTPTPAPGEFPQTYLPQWTVQYDIPQLKKRFDLGPDIWQPSFVRGEYLQSYVSQWASMHDVPQLKKRFDVGPDIWQPAFVAAEFLQSYVPQWASHHDVPQLKKRFSVGEDIWQPSFVAGEFLRTFVSQWASQHDIVPVHVRTGPNGEIYYAPQFIVQPFTAWPWTHHDPVAKTFNPIRPLDNVYDLTPAPGEFPQTYVSQWASEHPILLVRTRTGPNGEIFYEPQFIPAVTLITQWPWTHHDPVAKTFNPIRPLDNIWHQTPAFGEFPQTYVSQWASQYDVPQLKKRFDVGADIWLPSFVRGEFLVAYVSQWASQHDLPQLKKRFSPGEDIWLPSFVRGEFIAAYVSQWASQHDNPRLKARFELGADIWLPSLVPGEFSQTYVSQWASEYPVALLRARTGPNGEIYYAPQFVPVAVTTPTAWWMEYPAYQLLRAQVQFPRMTLDAQWPPGIYGGGVVTIGLPHNQPFINSTVGRMFGR